MLQVCPITSHCHESASGRSLNAVNNAWDSVDLPQGQAKVHAVRTMFDAIAPRYDLVNRIMTFRLDVRWRRKAIGCLGLPANSVILDLASGTGDMCIDLRKAGYQPLSMDLSLGMLIADRSNAPRTQTDILQLPCANNSVDGVTCGFALRNLLDLNTFLANSPASPNQAVVLPCSMSVSQPIHSSSGVTASTSARLSRASVDCFPTAPRTTTYQKASPTFPRLLPWLTCCYKTVLHLSSTVNSRVGSHNYFSRPRHNNARYYAATF